MLDKKTHTNFKDQILSEIYSIFEFEINFQKYHEFFLFFFTYYSVDSESELIKSTSFFTLFLSFTLIELSFNILLKYGWVFILLFLVVFNFFYMLLLFFFGFLLLLLIINFFLFINFTFFISFVNINLI